LDNVVGNFAGGLRKGAVNVLNQTPKEPKKEKKIEIVTPLTVQKVTKNIHTDKIDTVALLAPFSLEKDSFSGEECKKFNFFNSTRLSCLF
jgi:hypothetical protein